jgi:hypothetical protein
MLSCCRKDKQGVKTVKSKIEPFLAVILWAAAVAAGMLVLMRYQFAPGPEAAARDRWPPFSLLRRDPLHPTLVMAVHPHCPCTQASLEELARVVARSRGRLTVKILVYKPDGSGEVWEKTDLWRKAAAIPGVTVVADEYGEEAARFHASTSGEVLLFDPSGRLLFEGGITAARGRPGDNPGEDAVAALVSGGAARRTRMPVFGCSLLDRRARTFLSR